LTSRSIPQTRSVTAECRRTRAGPAPRAWRSQFVINYEEGGENCRLHGDPASKAFLSEIVGAQPLPGVRHMSMESIYEYGSRAGLAPVAALPRGAT
jgi:hypothetical protein